LLRQSRPISEVTAFGNTGNRWRHYGKLPWLPDGFVSIGDAVCALNPRYGQGMTVAALGAEQLDLELSSYSSRRGNLHGFSHHFQKRLEEVLKVPWEMALMEDRLWVQVFSGEAAGLAQRLTMKAMSRFLTTTFRDIDTFIRFMRVAHMLDAPTKMLSPRVLAALVKGGAGGPPPEAPSIATAGGRAATAPLAPERCVALSVSGDRDARQAVARARVRRLLACTHVFFFAAGAGLFACHPLPEIFMVTEQQALKWLQTASGGAATTFHSGQWEAIRALVEDRSRVLLVQRTGWGKSMVYFLATRLLRDQGAGPTLIISPLLSLMRNQLDAARGLDLVAETINSSNRDEWAEIVGRVRENAVDLLLVSPERLANEEFLQSCLLPIAASITFFVVDEAHCISDWGHDFRPDYQRINRILQQLTANVAVLATTATANDRVIEDVLAQLGQAAVLQRGPLARRSLGLQNIDLPDRAERLAWLADNLPSLPGSGIIYTLTTRDADRVAAWLAEQGISAVAYHSQIEGDAEDAGSPGLRADLETKLLKNEVKALVATTALGMGFDKPDLGFVVHFQTPQSVVHYYQQVGRAGRAIDRALGILFMGAEDNQINQHFISQAFPPEPHILAILSALEAAPNGLTVPNLMRDVNLRKGQIDKAIKLLAAVDSAPIGREGNRWVRTANPFQYDHQRIDRITRHRQAEWQQMRDYVASTECLMALLGRALDDPLAQPCGQCAPCLGRPLVPVDVNPSTVRAAIAFERRSEVIVAPRKLWPVDAFPAYGWRGKIGPNRLIDEGRALSLRGDVGWAQLVQHGLEQGRFHDDLVMASAEMVQSRWQPSPPPAWVTCVPSLRAPHRVSDFAQRLAARLGLPFAAVVSKAHETEPQRALFNAWKQAHNLDGAFTVDMAAAPASTGPVLLVDDTIDSRWTMTVIGALLRQAGAPKVYPLALSMAYGSSG